jgi:ubiquinone/menaquinone biosynthesis C-methylase UbiE
MPGGRRSEYKILTPRLYARARRPTPVGFHTFDPDRAAALEDESRYRHCSRAELHALIGPHDGMVLADLGSGTGFYTDDIAPHVDRCYAVDVQDEMHDRYREKGVPATVDLVTASAADLPVPDDALDCAFSTMTYHEFADDAALDELARVLRPGGRLVTVDWSAGGTGEAGPPTDERYDLADAVRHHLDHGFAVERAETRPETFVCVGRLE